MKSIKYIYFIFILSITINFNASSIPPNLNKAFQQLSSQIIDSLSSSSNYSSNSSCYTDPITKSFASLAEYLVNNTDDPSHSLMITTLLSSLFTLKHIIYTIDFLNTCNRQHFSTIIKIQSISSIIINIINLILVNGISDFTNFNKIMISLHILIFTFADLIRILNATIYINNLDKEYFGKVDKVGRFLLIVSAQFTIAITLSVNLALSILVNNQNEYNNALICPNDSKKLLLVYTMIINCSFINMAEFVNSFKFYMFEFLPYILDETLPPRVTIFKTIKTKILSLYQNQIWKNEESTFLTCMSNYAQTLQEELENIDYKDQMKLENEANHFMKSMSRYAQTLKQEQDQQKRQKQIIKYRDICPICRQEFKFQESEIYELPCAHIFCTKCLNEYFEFLARNNGQRYNCPVCRETLTEDIDLEKLKSFWGMVEIIE